MKALPLPVDFIDEVLDANITLKDLVCLVANFPECYINMSVLSVEDGTIKDMICVDLHSETWSFVISPDLIGANIENRDIPKYFDKSILESISVYPYTSGSFNFDHHKIEIGKGLIEANLIESLRALRSDRDRLSDDDFYVIGVYNTKDKEHLQQIAQDSALWGHLMNK